MPQPDRIEKLSAMLAQSPDDPFLLYALAMERKQTDPAEAMRLFQRVVEVDPAQCYAYYQLGQTRERIGDIEAAKSAYRDGLAAAARFGDEHARGEIAAALELLVAGC